MKIDRLNLINIRGYKDIKLSLSPSINLIVGENNSGKTTLLKTLLYLQDSSSIISSDIRIGEEKGTFEIFFTGQGGEKHFIPPFLEKVQTSNDGLRVTFTRGRAEIEVNGILQNPSVNCIYKEEDRNFIYPFLSKRKVTTFNEDIRSEYARSVSGNFQNLFAKVDRITTDRLPAKALYMKACTEILGFYLSAYQSSNGKKAVHIVSNYENIPLEAMGEGVANVLGLILDLCISTEPKLFLIEELENDIHPKALKKLLGLILEYSKTHQFIITTHSNIVLKILGANQDNKIFNVEMKFDNEIPTSSISEVDNSPVARRAILEDLGYELLDFDVCDTWLILEESSAEVIIREFLIPKFAPLLKERLRTCSAGGVDKVRARFDALHSLCLFLHLQDSFKDRIWVLVDGGNTEQEIIDDLQDRYKSWSKDHFCQLQEHDFEKYYPNQFQEEVMKVLSIPSRDKKREEKRKLLREVKDWYTENPEPAKAAFSQSAIEVINILQSIQEAVEGSPPPREAI
jgi:predicted ATPase